MMAEYVFHFLIQSAESCWLKIKGHQNSKLDSDSFKIGFIDGFYEALTLDTLKVSQVMNKESKSLIVQASSKVQNYLEDCYPRMKSLKSRSRKVSKEHYQSGKVQGQQTKVSKPVESSNSNKIRFLGFKK